MTELALFGGEMSRSRPFPPYNTMGEEEAAAAEQVVRSGVLSRYIGADHENFMGGPEVRAFEGEWQAAYRARHALAVNSCTSGLYAAVGASGAGPGDEVIVSPFTMVASATAAVVYNAVPVFADIDPQTYCMSPESIRERITPRTKAIIVVHWYGHPADMDAIMEIAAEHNILVIEDAAQAPFATYKGRPVGTLGHIGVFSLNYHKHIHTGEGGVVTTNDDELAERVALIRNHAEAAVASRPVSSLINMIGFNFRMGEIEAAIGRCQLRRGPDLVAARQRNVAYLEAALSDLPFLAMPRVAAGCTHAYYTHAIRYDAAATGVSGSAFVRAVRAELPHTELRENEGALIGFGSARPLYRLPMYRELTGYGDVGCPFKCPHYEGVVDYSDGICPHAEAAHESLIVHEFMQPSMSEGDTDDVAAAFHKVAANLDALRAEDGI